MQREIYIALLGPCWFMGRFPGLFSEEVSPRRELQPPTKKRRQRQDKRNMNIINKV